MFLKNIRLSKRAALNLLIFLLLVYFSFHSIYGNRGIIAYFKLNQQLNKAQNELEDLRAERVEIEHRVKLLRPDSLDKDMLDEQARSSLGMASPGEKVFTPSPQVMPDN